MSALPNSQEDPGTTRLELAAEVLDVFGLLKIQVTGWSMLPTVWPGEFLVIERVSTENVREGDIVLFRQNESFRVHRVVKKHPADRFMWTWGDSMPHPDPAVDIRHVLGRVSYILRDGRRIKPSREPGFVSRVVALVLRRSDIAVRAVVHLHGMLQNLNSNRRVIPCQN